MRILFLSNFYPPHEIGGYEQWCREVADALRARGHQTAILTSRYRNDVTSKHEDGIYRLLYLQTRDLAHYRPLDFFLHQPRHERENRAALEQVIKEFRPDVFFVWGMWNLSRSVPAYAEGRGSPPVVYYISDLWPITPDTHATYWNLPTRHELTRPLKAALRYLGLGMLTRQGWPHLLRFQHAICVSHYIRNTLTAAGLPLAEAAVIHGGTDVDQFSQVRRERKENSAHLELLYAGQLAEHKGVATAIEAMARLTHDHLPLSVRLTLVGSGHPGYEAYLRTQVQMAGLQDRVVFRGAVPREQMPQVLAEHDVLLFPSTGPEALPRMVQEGMAAGLVVVGTTTGGTEEILVHDENGLVFEPGDAAGLAAQIERLLVDPDLRRRLAENGRRTVMERFTLDRMVDEIEAYLLEVLHKGRGS